MFRAVCVSVCFFGLGVGSLQAAAAPPLASVRISKVSSPQWNGETIPPNAISTQKDHGGAWIRFETIEDGYGKTDFGFPKFKGLKAVQDKPAEPVFFQGTRIVSGWKRFWKLESKFTSGVIEYQATSSVFPYKTRYVRLTVR